MGSKAEKSRELTKRQRWTGEEWAEVEKASSAANETPSDFIRAATLQRCQKQPNTGLVEFEINIDKVGRMMYVPIQFSGKRVRCTMEVISR